MLHAYRTTHTSNYLCLFKFSIIFLAQNQISMMKSLIDDQQNLKELTAKGFDELAEKNDKIKVQQNDIILASDIQRFKVENNIRELDRERGLIKAGQIELGQVLSALKSKIGEMFFY